MRTSRGLPFNACVRWGVRGFYPDLRPSLAVGRRRTLYNTVVLSVTYVHYLIHTHLGPEGDGAPPWFQTNSSPGGLPLTHYRLGTVPRSPCMAEAGTGGPPLISELYRCINVFPPCLGGIPGTGGPPLISKLHRHIKVVPPCMGGGPGTGGPPLISFPLWQIKIPPPLVGRGPGIGGPPLISVQPFRYGSRKQGAELGKRKGGGGKSDMGGTAHV